MAFRYHYRKHENVRQQKTVEYMFITMNISYVHRVTDEHKR
jgi:hypothetical protein